MANLTERVTAIHGTEVAPCLSVSGGTLQDIQQSQIMGSNSNELTLNEHVFALPKAKRRPQLDEDTYISALGT